MTRKKDDLIEFTDNGMGLKWAILYDEHAAKVPHASRKFDARIDNTDHAAFYCEKCDREVRIVQATFYKEAKDEHKLKLVYVLRFELLCEVCGGSEMKKMYLNNPIPGNINWH